MLAPRRLAGRIEDQHRFCPTPSCATVYFGASEVFVTTDLRVPVFCKEAPGNRTVCYCFEIDEAEIRQAARDDRAESVFSRIRELVRRDRCICSVRNPHGSCCLTEVLQVEKAARDDQSDARDSEIGCGDRYEPGTGH